MHNRMLDISDSGARLSVRHRQLVISRADCADVTVPFAEIAVLVLAHPQISCTQPVLAALVEQGGMLVTCDEKRLPAGMLLPLKTHSVQTERLAAQASVSVPTRKRLWRQIVRAKVAAQAEILAEFRQSDFGLRALLPRIKSGDRTNVEAQAARRYWIALFASNTFRRDPDALDQNRMLNYGYAVLRAIVARAICAAGLHPSLGLHHRNKYNAFCLADDLMEPFRPVVDRIVAEHVAEHGFETDLGQEARRALLQSLSGRCLCDGESRTLFDTVSRVASSLADVFLGSRKELALPERVVHAAT
jgi:CRISPR-associated protein Cas1